MKYGMRFLCAALSASLAAALSSCSKADEAPPPPVAARAPFSFAGRPEGGITFLSTQLNPVEEAGKMRDVLLADFPGRVDFRPNDNSFIFEQVASLLDADPDGAILLGALHGDLAALRERGELMPLDGVYKSLGYREFPESLLELGRLGARELYYVPWMQASFVMVANRKALPYLPKGAELGNLSYGQLREWAEAIRDATGMKALGFPAGEKGLMHRFFQGYLYPSFTGSTLLKFRSADAEAMWAYFLGLWDCAHPSSLVYMTMSEPLLADDVWIAWDHTARLVDAFEKRPDDFVAFPAPVGPRGRGYMTVVSGLGIPARTKDWRDAALLIDYLTTPAIQLRTLVETGFFPAVTADDRDGLPGRLASLSGAVRAQVDDPAGVATLLPVGLGALAGDYNRVFMLAFSDIVLERKPIAAALDEKAAALQRILNEANAGCWLPDVSVERPCRIE